MSRIYLSPPHVGTLEREMLLDAFDSNWIAPLGPHVDAFEREICERVGVGHAVALSSGSAALHLALLGVGVQRGDEVLLPTLTFAATANAVSYVGAEPVLLDSAPGSWNLDPDLLLEELEACARRGKRPGAVIAVDLYGQCADYDRIRAACARHEVPLIEDAAEALGATYRDRSAGGLGKFGVFSFNGNKIITTSGGGVLVSDDAGAIAMARHLATQAREPAPHYEHARVGYNYRLSNLLAALGRAQLRGLDERIALRRATQAAYHAALGQLPGLSFPAEPGYSRGNGWLTVILLDPARSGVNREQLRLALEALDIESRPVWKPMHLQPVWRGCRTRGGERAAALFERGLCLPSGSSLRDEDRQRVIDGVLAAFEVAGASAGGGPQAPRP